MVRSLRWYRVADLVQRRRIGNSGTNRRYCYLVGSAIGLTDGPGVTRFRYEQDSDFMVLSEVLYVLAHLLFADHVSHED